MSYPPFQYAVPQVPGTKEIMIDVAKSDIKVPVDIQGQLEIKEELYAQSGLAAQTITMDKSGYKEMTADFKSLVDTEKHTVTLEYSFDNTNWRTEVVVNAISVWCYATEHAARYWRLSSNNNAGGAHNVDLVLGAVP